MVKFLLERPIAVTMTFIAILVLGFFSITFLPVSLMPDIDVPEITVQVNAQNMPAREVEDAIVTPLRRQLMQSSHLNDIKSVARDENALIHLRFDYGTDINYAFIEVNEKIDQSMSGLPREISRPKVVKTSATDLPVLYLNLTVNDDEVRFASNELQQNNQLYPTSQRFIELSRFASSVIRKRIEQLPEVAMVDMSGMVYSEILVIPDIQKLNALKLSLQDLENALYNNNVELGNLLIQDGQYQYNVRFSSTLKNIRDIMEVYLRVDDRIFQLKDLAEVIEHPQKRSGMITSNGKDALALAIIKQSDAQMMVLEDKLNWLVGILKSDYPAIDFEITRDQTKLLNYSIANLKESLVWGAALAFLVMLFFMKDFKAPILIGITIPTSLVVCLLCFHLLGISINIISLSGLVLGVGMMVDNSIIVIDNITQHIQRGRPLLQACVKGTNEVIAPMLSAALTTCAVFIPLIFISGIAGALFYDQALAVAIGLFVSLAVAITILPVYYKLFYSKRSHKKGSNKFLNWVKGVDYEGLYEKGFRFTMRNQKSVWGIVFFMLICTFFLYQALDKSKLPPITQDETLLVLDWNESINIEENSRRVQQLLAYVEPDLLQHTCMIGDQQFLLDKKSNATSSEATIYLKVKSPDLLSEVKSKITEELSQNPLVVFGFAEAENVFEMIFADDEAPLTARLVGARDFGDQQKVVFSQEIDQLKKAFPDFPIRSPAMQEHMVLKIDPLKTINYGISKDVLYRTLKSAFNEREVMTITDNQYFIPVILGERPRLIGEVLSETFVPNNRGILYPVSDLISEGKDYDLKEIYAGQEGEYFPVDFDIKESEVSAVVERVQSVLGKNNLLKATFTGAIFSNKELIKELLIILTVSLLLLYFILASQFESLILPLIILLEVPIGIFGAFLMLALFGQTINIMAMIGIVAMVGIIINDSILKIDTVNQLRKDGYSILRALATAGQRRLKAIVMTSLTTTLALVPLLFSSGLGSDLQVPLALAVIGGMTVGTLVSLYFIPLCYYYLKR